MAQLSNFGRNGVCVFCKRNTNDEFTFGKIYKCADVKLHYFCLLFATHLRQNGRDNEDFLGFLIPDIRQELRRNSKVICSYCNVRGASCSCGSKNCVKNFHFPCGLENNSFHTFFGQFRSFCSEHSRKPPVPLIYYLNQTDIICVICQEQIENLSDVNVVHASCCNSICFHKNCIQKMALSAGYFFKCPNCNDQRKFRDAMRKNGIYIPDQDAAWELAPDSFHELYQQYSSCDADVCLCPHGQSYSDSVGFWSIVRCNTCGSQGIHKKCGRNSIRKKEWTCSMCAEVSVNSEPFLLDVSKNRFTSEVSAESSTKRHKRTKPLKHSSFFETKRKYQSRKHDGITKVTPVYKRKSMRYFKPEKRVRYIIDNAAVSILPSIKSQLRQFMVVLSR